MYGSLMAYLRRAFCQTSETSLPCLDTQSMSILEAGCPATHAWAFSSRSMWLRLSQTITAFGSACRPGTDIDGMYRRNWVNMPGYDPSGSWNRGQAYFATRTLSFFTGFSVRYLSRAASTEDSSSTRIRSWNLSRLPCSTNARSGPMFRSSHPDWLLVEVLVSDAAQRQGREVVSVAVDGLDPVRDLVGRQVGLQHVESVGIELHGDDALEVVHKRDSVSADARAPVHDAARLRIELEHLPEVVDDRGRHQLRVVGPGDGVLPHLVQAEAAKVHPVFVRKVSLVQVHRCGIYLHHFLFTVTAAGSSRPAGAPGAWSTAACSASGGS